MPVGRPMTTVDEQLVRAPLERIFRLAAEVEGWPALLPHYRYVRFTERRSDGGGIVEMSASRPVGAVRRPTGWKPRTRTHPLTGPVSPSNRVSHIEGVTKGMEVEWSFQPVADGTHVRIVHVWEGPGMSKAGETAATLVIGPVFVHGIASRTLAGLAAVAERGLVTGGAT